MRSTFYIAVKIKKLSNIALSTNLTLYLCCARQTTQKWTTQHQRHQKSDGNMSNLLNFLWDLLLIAYPFIIHIPHLKLSWAFVNSSGCVPGKITLMRLRAEGMLLWLYHNYFLHLTSKDARSGSVKELRICWEPVEAIRVGCTYTRQWARPGAAAKCDHQIFCASNLCKMWPPTFLCVKACANLTTVFSWGQLWAKLSKIDLILVHWA